MIMPQFRELLEEASLTASYLEAVGVLTFEFVGEPDLMEVHVFKCQQYEGHPQESEGRPGALHIYAIHLTDMCYLL